MDGNRIISWSGATRSGSRKETNDDSWIAFSANAKGSVMLSEDGRGSLAEQDLVFAVSDGMGGGNAGHIASSLILERMAKHIPGTFRAAAAGFYPDPISRLEELLKDVHEHINREGEATENCQGMSATLAMTWFSPENMYLANVGDSRIYRCRNGRTEQLSVDHTSAWGQLQRGEIGEAEYRTHPRRAALYRVIGGGNPVRSPHFAAIGFETGDRFLVCSDGVVDGLWERHIGEALAYEQDSRECCGKLLDRAVGNAGKDDTTLIVIDVS